MTITSAHEATATVVCKVPGCTERALASRGTYALLCERHKIAKRRELGLEFTAPRPRLAPATSSREQAARRLVAAGQRVDQARARAERARRQLQPKLDALREAEQEWAREVANLTASSPLAEHPSAVAESRTVSAT